MRMIVSECLTFKSVIWNRRWINISILSVFAAMIFLSFVSNLSLARENVVLNSTEARYVSELDAWITFKGEVSFHGEGKLLEINLSIPYSNKWQNVISYPSECELLKDKDGNTICSLKIKNPPNTYRYELKFHVVSKSFEVKHPLESSNLIGSAYPAEIQQYLLPTENIQSNAPEIRSLARRLTQNATNDFEKVAALAIWVNENVEYDEGYADENKDALWVLKNRRGVCAEYTTLFIALARAIGIPARYAHVYAFGKNGWESHAIAEVYVGDRWIPVDVLWLEVGNVDATHIYMGSYLDNKISNNIKVEGYNIRDINWNSEEPQFEVSLVEKQFPRDDVALYAAPLTLPLGGSGVVWVKITPTTTKVDKLILLPCKGASILEIEDSTAYVTEAAGKNAYHYWIVKASNQLDPHYEYICPLTLNTYYTEPRALPVEIKVSPLQKPHAKCWRASLLRQEVQSNADVGVIVNAEGCVTPLKLYVGNDVMLESYDLQSESRIFYLPQTPSQRMFVFDEHGGYQVLSYTTSDVKLPYIGSVFHPSTVYNGSEITIKVEIFNPSKAQNLTIKIGAEEFKLENGKNELEANIKPRGTGERMVWVKLLMNDEVVDAIPVVYKIIEKTEMKVKDVYARDNRTFLLISINNVCHNLSVLVDGKNYVPIPNKLLAGDNRVMIDAPLSGKNAEIVCFDEVGSKVVWRGELKGNGVRIFIGQMKENISTLLSELIQQLNTIIKLIFQTIRG